MYSDLQICYVINCSINNPEIERIAWENLWLTISVCCVSPRLGGGHCAGVYIYRTAHTDGVVSAQGSLQHFTAIISSLSLLRHLLNMNIER